MLPMRYPTAALTFLLLAAGGLGGNFFERSGFSGEPTSTPTEFEGPDVRLPNKPLRDNPPVVVEVLADYPGADAEEVERQVTIPLEVALAGMSQVQTLRSKSVAGLSRLHVGIEPGADYDPVTVTDRPVKITGTAAVVKRFADRKAQVILLAAGKAQYGALAVEATGPLSIEGDTK